MALQRFEFWAYDLGAFRVLFARVRDDMTAPVGVTYIDAGQYIQHDTLPAADAFRFSNALRRIGYVRSEVQP